MGFASFSFGIQDGYDVIPENVVALFSGVSSDEDYEFESEIIEAGMKGRIDFEKNFNIRAYSATIRKNLRLVDSQRKDIYYFTSDADEIKYNRNAVYEGSVGTSDEGKGYVTRVPLRSAYEQVENDLTLQQIVDQIVDLNDDLLKFEHIDFIKALKGAILGITESVDAVRTICEKYTYVGDWVKTLLSGGKSIAELFEGV